MRALERRVLEQIGGFATLAARAHRRLHARTPVSGSTSFRTDRTHARRVWPARARICGTSDMVARTAPRSCTIRARGCRPHSHAAPFAVPGLPADGADPVGRAMAGTALALLGGSYVPTRYYG
jgi:hypothetical protein